MSTKRRFGSSAGPMACTWLVSAHRRSRLSSSALCASRVVAAANACTWAASASACGVPRLVASRKSRTQPEPPISGSALAAVLGATGVVNSR